MHIPQTEVQCIVFGFSYTCNTIRPCEEIECGCGDKNHIYTVKLHLLQRPLKSKHFKGRKLGTELFHTWHFPDESSEGCGWLSSKLGIGCIPQGLSPLVRIIKYGLNNLPNIITAKKSLAMKIKYSKIWDYSMGNDNNYIITVPSRKRAHGRSIL